MRRVTVKVESSTARPIDAEMRTEARRDRTSPYNVQNSYAVTSGTKDAERVFLLGDNDRIVIEPRGTVELVYNREQGAARPAEADANDALKDENAKALYEQEHSIEREALSKGKTPEMLKQEQIEQAAAAERTSERLRQMREADLKAKQEEMERRTVAPGIAERPTMKDDPRPVPPRPAVAPNTSTVPPKPPATPTSAKPAATTDTKPEAKSSSSGPSAGAHDAMASSKDVKK